MPKKKNPRVDNGVRDEDFPNATKFIMLSYQGSGPDITEYDHAGENEMLKDAARLAMNGAQVRLYEVKRIDFELVARRKKS